MQTDSALGENFLPSLQTAAISLDAHMTSSVCALRESKRTPEKIYFDVSDYTKAFDCVDHHKLWKILQEMGIPYHLTCFM